MANSESSNFVDYVKVHCQAGNGGQGSMHFLRTKTDAKGGPDGGDGGRGGHVILRGNRNLWTLLHLKFRKHIKSGHGGHGSRNRQKGADGWDEVIDVPLGTVAIDAETNEWLFEIKEHDEMQILRFGGMGGRGNDHFKTSTNQAPRYAQSGIPGEEGWNILELKVLADVGLVGFPNAGKSTLLSVISAAKPKIANYPFTTMTPNLGVIDYRNGTGSFVMADIPGIIEGASEGKGLGNRFLRHIEKNALLLLMVPADSDDIIKEVSILKDELFKFSDELSEKEQIIVITKCDLLDEELKELIQIELDKINLQVLFISSVAMIGINVLKDSIWQKLQVQKNLI